ncbi:MAG: transglutaminase domain-containing protein [Actinomycetes bacterium]
MRFDIRYTSRFRYEGPVSESQNELRACPVTDHRQQVSHYRVTTSPSARIHSYTDHFGTRVDTFGIRSPHRSLEVVAEATVETVPVPVVAASPRFAELEAPAFRDAHLQYLATSRHTDAGGAVVEEARRRAELAGDDVLGTVLAIHRAVATTLSYIPGSTFVGVDVDEVFANRAGVCQDFAHLAVAMCRAVGIPARYVSGYLFARDDTAGAEPDEDEIDVVTHAWLEAAVPGAGWVGLDPTNRQQVGPRHVKIGHGRDYDDVAPLRGVYVGPAAHELEVAVHLRRMAHVGHAEVQQQHQQQQ